MNLFNIAETRFGIDAAGPKVRIARSIGGEVLLSVDVKGNRELFEEITADEESEWSWALYPPAFYLHEMPVSEEAIVNGGEIVISEREEFEIGIYMMEYCEVKNVCLSVKEGQSVTARGIVEMWGKDMPFSLICSLVGVNA